MTAAASTREWLEGCPHEDLRGKCETLAKENASLHEKVESLEAEIISLKQALADRKVIERAKGILMQYSGLSEDEAYKKLRRCSCDKQITLAEMAQRILETAQLMAN